MDVEVFQHRHFDVLNGTSVVQTRHATRGYIERSKGEVLEETRRLVDERLLDDEGRILLELNHEEIELLRQLAARENRRATMSGNANRKPLDRLVQHKLTTSRALNLSDTEHELTPLGELAVKQLT